MTEIKIRLGGVPEHFNLPVHLAIENGAFKQIGIDLQWTDFPGGTGQMTKALRNDEADVCIALTEGMITDIIKGNPSKLIGVYVQSPLKWGIHTGANNPLQNPDDVFDKRHAISRFGSGSHLMAIVNAYSHGLSLKEDQFEVIGNLDGALDSLSQLKTDVFYWEKFTTKPYVDSGQLRRVGEYPTPWPCFVIAASDTILTQQPEAIKAMLATIYKSCRQFMKDENMIPLLSKRYNLKFEDVSEWYAETHWATDSQITDEMLKQVVFHLKAAGILEEDQVISDLVW